VSYIFNGISLQNGRQSNMDSLLLKNRIIDKKNIMLAVVCDGVGSLSDGAFASGTAVKMLSEWFSELTDMNRIGIILRDVILKINLYIVSEAKKNNMNTASTLSALLLIENNYYAVHIGDSRIYIYENDLFSILTNDDVSESGKLRGCIGQTENIFLQYFEGAAENKTFLLCSDGLYKRMNIEFLTEKMKNFGKRYLKEYVNSLPKYVIECGEKDNITFALIKMEN